MVDVKPTAVATQIQPATERVEMSFEELQLAMIKLIIKSSYEGRDVTVLDKQTCFRLYLLTADKKGATYEISIPKEFVKGLLASIQVGGSCLAAANLAGGALLKPLAELSLQQYNTVVNQSAEADRTAFGASEHMYNTQMQDYQHASQKSDQFITELFQQLRQLAQSKSDLARQG